MNIRPLFIMGSARSGTTWLANILSNHPAVAAPTCVEHHGIHESHIFDHTRYVFPDDIECEKFIDEYKNEDIYKLLSIDGNEFCKKYVDKNDIFYWFSELMNEFATNKNAQYWLEKTPKHLIYYDEILNIFPEAEFVLITRGFKRTILSNLTKYARSGVGRARQIIEKSYRYELDLRALERLRRLAACSISITYEELASDPDKQVALILNHLSLLDQKLKSNFEADSSYKRNNKEYIMRRRDWLLAYFTRAITRLMPYTMMCHIRKTRDKKSKKTFPLYMRIK